MTTSKMLDRTRNHDCALNTQGGNPTAIVYLSFFKAPFYMRRIDVRPAVIESIHDNLNFQLTDSIYTFVHLHSVRYDSA